MKSAANNASIVRKDNGSNPKPANEARNDGESINETKEATNSARTGVKYLSLGNSNFLLTIENMNQVRKDRPKAV